MKLLFEGWRKFLNEEESDKPKKSDVVTAIDKELDKEGGAAGLDPLVKTAQEVDPDATEEDVKQMLSGMSNVKQHEDGDYVDAKQLAEAAQVFLEMKEEMLDEKRRKRKKSKKKKTKKKDACYHKVKARYSVWPSAYASGALVKCRKVGAKNWGTGGKKKKK